MSHQGNLIQPLSGSRAFQGEDLYVSETGCLCTYLLNSSSGLAVWEWAEGERGSGFRLLLKACRCFTSSLTTRTCSSVGLNDSWIQSKRQENNEYHMINIWEIVQEN